MILEFSKFLMEGTLDRETTLISRVIIDNIKRKKDSILGMPSNAYYQFNFSKGNSGLMDRSAKALGFYVYDWGNLNIPENLISLFPNMLVYVGIGDPIHRGYYDRQSDVLFVQIEIPKTDNNNLNYNAVLPYLKSILRHELEHSQQKPEAPYTRVRQYGWEDIKDKAPAEVDFGNPELIEKYYTHPSEIEAWVSGLYKHAKTSKQPFFEILNDRLNKISSSMTRRNIDRSIIDRIVSNIRKKWMDYASFRFPKAPLA